MFKFNKLTSSLLSGIIAASIILLLSLTNVFESLELKTLDMRFRAFAKPETASKDVVIAVIDDKSLQSFEKQGMYWPWSRDVYAELVGYLKRGGAKTITFDILFPSPDIDRVSSNGDENDHGFADSMKSAHNVLLAMQLKEEITPANFKLSTTQKFTLPHEAASTTIFSSALLPLPLFQQSAYAIGAVNYFSDGDGICRRVPPLLHYNHNTFPHLGFASYLTGTGTTAISFDKEKKLLDVAGNNIPVDNNGNFLIWWYGNGGPQGCFQYYSIQSLIYSAVQEKRKQLPSVPSETFKDKYVIIGANSPGLIDFRNTPFTSEEPYPGMEIYATMVSNVLQKDYLHRGNFYISLLVTFGFSIAVSFAMFYLKKVGKTVILTCGLVATWLVFSCYFFATEKLWFEIASPLIAILGSFALSASWSYSTEGKARQQLRSLFNRYLDPSVVEQIEMSPEKVELGGTETEAAIFFSDIENFTRSSEHLPPQEVIKQLNEYFSLSVDILLKHGAFLDKYIGDAVMASFGIPLRKPDDIIRACRASLEIQAALLIKQKDSPNVHTRTRIGIHCGKIVFGNIGSSRRMEFTSIGDTVNVASRLEGVNKIYGTSIIISEHVYEKVKDVFECRELDIVTLKGKDVPTRIYELLSEKNALPQETKELVTHFHNALALYRKNNFEEALGIFTSLKKQFPSDIPSAMFVTRCESFIASPPSPDWGGVFHFDTK